MEKSLKPADYRCLFVEYGQFLTGMHGKLAKLRIEVLADGCPEVRETLVRHYQEFEQIRDQTEQLARRLAAYAEHL